ncbi:Triacylglycerol lipase [Handroanthus impetiginosus]|uniref:Triacylglycerol lipase n=1 Tax=Handroanthus impetiginosus TaxID=429701 RepID=A0A2G9GGM2_9LAMI|nr:Triacylglycerol lipase [Handroanthus impetiginosus]
MAPSATNLILLIILSIFINIPQILNIHAQQQVPCLFFFGDSISDNGNNNALTTLAKSNYPPYGIDFPDGLTGRFSNGEIVPDALAKFLGFANPIPPFAAARGSDILKGVNYASGGAGILDESGIQLGSRISMSRQLLNHQITVRRIQNMMRNQTTEKNNYVGRCLYVVNIGSNDYINNYFVPNTQTRRLQTPDSFAETLIQKFSQQLRTLYNSGARKIAVFGVGLLGCIPQVIANNPTNASGCVDFINNAVQLFNNKVKPLVDNLKSDLNGAQFTYINITSISSADPSVLGIRVVNASCCPVSRQTGQCIPNRNPCSNRNEYIFWDNVHPTEIVNIAMASRAYNATLPSDAYPVDIRRLVQQ